MDTPFTVEQFLAVFARYNEAVWPMPLVFYGVAALLVVLAWRGPRFDRWVAGLLSSLWAWMAVVYHWGFFAEVNAAAYVFGGLFLLQSAIFLSAGVFHRRLSFRARPDGFGMVGVVMINYALIVYPLLGWMAGHPYPIGPTFGLPCPTTIVTFGLLLWADRPVPPWVIAVPTAWSLVGSSAAISFDIVEDFGLVTAGIVGTALILWKNHRGNNARTFWGDRRITMLTCRSDTGPRDRLAARSRRSAVDHLEFCPQERAAGVHAPPGARRSESGAPPSIRTSRLDDQHARADGPRDNAAKAAARHLESRGGSYPPRRSTAPLPLRL
ncbi:MAG: DUF6064 family protein [Dehalococcoidia bacterium]